MMMLSTGRSICRKFLWVVLFWAAPFSLPVSAEVHILTVGGGPEPSFDQVSLEKNADYFRTVIKDLGAGGCPQQLLFADGGAGDHVVQYVESPDDKYRFWANLEMLISDGNLYRLPANIHYRKTALSNIQGPATADALTRWFTQTGASIPAGDQLLFYYTGHGGADADRMATPRNTTLELWDQPRMTMREFVNLLDKTNPAVDIMLVMVQCHSGGFANVLYNGGDPKKGIAKQLRFGFFSTTAPRLAAGCTPDIQGDDYREFSTAFFAALCGKTRAGQMIVKPDYDHKGKISYMDAFTYVLLTSDTIDLPMTTSDLLLRDFSQYGHPVANEKTTTRPTTHASTNSPLPRLMGADAPFAEISASATEGERAAINGLGKILQLDAADPVHAAKLFATRVDQERTQLRGSIRTQEINYFAAREKLRKSVFFQWPELRDPWLPNSETAGSTEQLSALWAKIQALPEYAEYHESFEKYAEVNFKSEALEKSWVKARRIIERANTVILRANLNLVATPQVQERFQLLQQHENGSLTADHF